MTVEQVLTFVRKSTNHGCSEKFARKIKRISEELRFIDKSKGDVIKTDNAYISHAFNIATNFSLYCEHNKNLDLPLDFVRTGAIMSGTH